MRLRIRSKLLLSFGMVALLVPVLGLVAIARIIAIDGNVEEIGDQLVPTIVDVAALSRNIDRRSMATEAYSASGRPADRTELFQLQEQFAGIAGRVLAFEDPATTGLIAPLIEQEATFRLVTNRLVIARDVEDRNLQVLRDRLAEISQEAAAIRGRYAPQASNPADATTISLGLRNQISDLLLSTEGMMHSVALQYALAESYVITPSDQTRRQFDSAVTTFNNWLQAANTAGGPEDRTSLARVQTKFVEFELNARSLMTTTDVVTRTQLGFRQQRATIDDFSARLLEKGQADATAETNAADQTVNTSLYLVLASIAVAFGVAGGLGLWLSHVITTPLVKLRNIADQASRGEFSDTELGIESSDEIGELAESFHLMMVSIRLLMPEDEQEGTAA